MKPRLMLAVLSLLILTCTGQSGQTSTLTLLDGEQFHVESVGRLLFAPGPDGKREQPAFNLRYDSHVDVHDRSALARETHKIWRIVQLYAETGDYTSAILGALGPPSSGLLSHQDGFNTRFVKRNGIWQQYAITPPTLVKPLRSFAWLLGTWSCAHRLPSEAEFGGLKMDQVNPNGTAIEESELFSASSFSGLGQSELSFDSVTKTWAWQQHLLRNVLEVDRSAQEYSRRMQFVGIGKDANVRYTYSVNSSETHWEVLIEKHSSTGWSESERIRCARKGS